MTGLLRLGLCLFTALLLHNVQPAYAQAPSFADVSDDNFAKTFIETLAYNGITSGCGGGNYCPDDLVTRAQMAIFLERGMNGGDFVPPAATGNVFTDVGINFFGANFIEQLAADGITSGCGGGNYCPDAPVTRAQMAVFLERAMNGSGYQPPAATGNVFGDVSDTDFAANFIEQLAADGITSGCGGGNYCPADNVTRAQMAVFLVRAFGLQPPDPVDPPVLGPIEQKVADLTAQYGPVLYFHPNEVFLPSTVEWYIGQSELAGSFNPADLKCDGGAVCDRFPLGQPGDSRQTLLDNLVGAVAANSNYENLWLETPDTTKGGDLASAESYVHYLDLGGIVDIQYWFFYPFNGPGRARVQFGEIHDETSSLAPLGEHYGDWEVVILRFTDEDELLGAFMSAHGDYTWYPADALNPADALQYENGRVLAYSTFNGHAIYPTDVPNKYDNRVVHEYAGWRNQCIGGEFWGNCVGYRTDVGIGTLDVDLLDTTARGQSFDTAGKHRLVAIDGEPVVGEEWVDLDIRWGQQRSGGASDISNDQFKQIMEDQIGAIALITIAGGAAVCLPPVVLIPVVGQALCAAYAVAIVPTLIYAYETGADGYVAELINEEFNGPKTPGAKGFEYIYAGCPTENKVSVLCPEVEARQDEYLVAGVLYGGGNSNQMGDIDGDGKDELLSFLNGGVIVVKRYVEEVDDAGVVSTSIQQQQFTLLADWGGGYNYPGDFDGDGSDEIISAIGNQILVRFFTPNNLGGSWSSRSWPVDTNQYGSPANTWVADLDGDEKDEVITISGGNIWVRSYNRVYEVVLDDEGKVVPDPDEAPLLVDEIEQRLFLTASYWGSAGFNKTGDIDGDGKDEIISAIGASIAVRRFVDTDVEGSDGVFELTVYPTRGDWWNGGYFWLADFDGDGDEDVLTASGNNVYVRSFNGAGFDDISITLPGSSWGSAQFSWGGDFDGDGKDGLATASGATFWIKNFASIAPSSP